MFFSKESVPSRMTPRLVSLRGRRDFGVVDVKGKLGHLDLEPTMRISIFLTIEFEEVVREPGFNFIQAVREGRGREHGGGFGGQVEQGVICIAVKSNAVFPKNKAKGE